MSPVRLHSSNPNLCADIEFQAPPSHVTDPLECSTEYMKLQEEFCLMAQKGSWRCQAFPVMCFSVVFLYCPCLTMARAFICIVWSCISFLAVQVAYTKGTCIILLIFSMHIISVAIGKLGNYFPSLLNCFPLSVKWLNLQALFFASTKFPHYFSPKMIHNVTAAHNAVNSFLCNAFYVSGINGKRAYYRNILLNCNFIASKWMVLQTEKYNLKNVFLSVCCI